MEFEFLKIIKDFTFYFLNSLYVILKFFMYEIPFDFVFSHPRRKFNKNNKL